MPELRCVGGGLDVQHGAPGVGRDAVQPAVVAVDVDLVERSVPEPVAVLRLFARDTAARV